MAVLFADEYIVSDMSLTLPAGAVVSLKGYYMMMKRRITLNGETTIDYFIVSTAEVFMNEAHYASGGRPIAKDPISIVLPTYPNTDPLGLLYAKLKEGHVSPQDI